MSLTEAQRKEVEKAVKYMVLNWLRGCPSYVDPDDAMSAAWEGVCDAAGRYAPGRATFKTYALIRARGAMIDWFRREYQVRRTDNMLVHSVEWHEEYPPAHESAMEYESILTEIMLKRLADMPEQAKKMFIAKFWGDQTLRQIAEAHGVSEARVSAIMNREFSKLKKPNYERDGR